MTLHTINKPLAFQHCVALVAAGDAILLIEDGVYAAMDYDANRFLLESLPADVSLHALADDLAARGISDTMLPRFESVTWEQFVALAATHDKVVSWG